MTLRSVRSSRGLALVSGGSGDIGEAICRRLHDDGWRLAIGYVSKARAEDLAARLATREVPAAAVLCDFTDQTATRASIEGLLEREGRVDALVCNAGWSRTARHVDSGEADWERTILVNFLGPVLLTHLCLPAMLVNGWGRIVGITSEAAKTGDAGHASYSAAKAALASFCKTIVREYGPEGIVANCVAPGPIDTGMLRSAFPTPSEAEIVIGKLTGLVPVGRLGRPDDVAAVVGFLVSDATFVAGEHISIGGGVVM